MKGEFTIKPIFIIVIMIVVLLIMILSTAPQIEGSLTGPSWEISKTSCCTTWRAMNYRGNPVCEKTPNGDIELSEMAIELGYLKDDGSGDGDTTKLCKEVMDLDLNKLPVE